jgi:hypothetical protein
MDFDDTDASRILFTEERYDKPKIHPHHFLLLCDEFLLDVRLLEPIV